MKVGPDYLDARLYGVACGRVARNLDLWLDGVERVRFEGQRACERQETILIEGMMGLFDGDDVGETSSAHVLRVLDVPAVIVLDGWSASQSLAAVALGCASMEPRVKIIGAILNRASGVGHIAAVRRALDGVANCSPVGRHI